MRMKRCKSKLPGIISSLFSVLLTILFAILAFFIAGYTGVFNRGYIAQAMNESNYYDNIYNVITIRAEALAKDAGLPKTVLTDVITLERVYISGANYVDSTFSGQESEIRTASISELLKNNVDNYIANQGIKVTGDIEMKNNTFIQEVVQEYKKHINLKLIKDLYDLKLRYSDFIKLIIPMLVLLIGLLCFMIIKLHSQAHRGASHIVYSLLAASLIMMITWICTTVREPFSNFEISPEYYKDFIVVCLQWTTKMFLLLGEIGLTLSLILTLFTGFLKDRAMNVSLRKNKIIKNTYV
jgi:hypothetical protein